MTFHMLYILNQNAELNPRDVKWEKEGEKQKKVVEGDSIDTQSKKNFVALVLSFRKHFSFLTILWKGQRLAILTPLYGGNWGREATNDVAGTQ